MKMFGRKKVKAKIKRTTKSKVTTLVLAAVGTVSLAATCIIAAVKPIKENKNNQDENKISFDATDLMEGMSEHLSDVIEYQIATYKNYNYPIKEYSVNTIVASNESMKVYGTATLNKKDFPEVNNLIEFAGEEYVEFYNGAYSEFINKVNANTASYEDAAAFLQQFKDAVNEENVVSVRDIELVKDQNTLDLSKQILQNFISTDATLSETDKETMSQSIKFTDELKIVDSHFVEQGFDLNTRKYIYNYTGLVFFNGYEFLINTDIATSNRVATSNELTTILLNQYKNQKDTFDIKNGKIENFQQILNEYLKQAETETENQEVAEEETEME